MAKDCFTVCQWEPIDGTKTGNWYDTTSFQTRKEAQGEFDWVDTKRKFLAIIKTDGSAKDMIQKRDALPAPKGWAKELPNAQA